MIENRRPIRRSNKKNRYHKSIKDNIINVIYFFVLALLIIITIRIFYQTIFFPDKIPDMFGIKVFIVFDEQQIDDSIKYGDLVITKNVEKDKLKIGDIAAFRNGSNTVILNKITNLEDIAEKKLEGLLIHKIAKLGSVLYFIGQPLVIIIISCAIIGIGLIFYYIAYRLDERDMKKIQSISQT